MRTGHLFAGGGGGLYADLILGHTPIFTVEWNPYACAILRSRAADGWFPGLRVYEGDARLFNPSEYAGGVDCIHAGFPCQDISLAGRGAGIHGKRSGLYREVLRCADVIRPQFIFLENSPAILSRGVGTVLGDLAQLGYNAKWTVLAAAEVGAPHERSRWWCLAWRSDADGLGTKREPGIIPLAPGTAQSEGKQRERHGRTAGYVGAANVANPPSSRSDQGKSGASGPIRDETRGTELERRSRHVADAGGAGLPEPERETLFGERGGDQGGAASKCGWWSIEPPLGRVVNGLALRSHQIRALGNGQVPLCAAAAWKILGGP